MSAKHIVVLLCALTILHVGCGKVPALVDYQNGRLGINRESAPIIIVGQLLRFTELGHPHPSHWYPDQPVQLYRVSVRVENVLRGDVGGTVVPIYYLSSMRSMGHIRMGMVGRGGHWQIGDRAIFFLTQDSGVLRTVVDTWAFATPPVLTGSHLNYLPRPNETVSDSIIDVLLDKGQGCDDNQWASAISTSNAYNYDLAYTVRKLRSIAERATPMAREAAKKELDALSYSWPKIQKGWPDQS